jgi:hypothetical protein
VQGNARRHRVARWILFHAIDEVICPLHPTHEFHQEPILIKKLLKGDRCWGTTKLLLGWLIDTVRQTLELPPHRYKHLCAIFLDLRAGFKSVSLKAWQKVLGELCSMVLAIPGCRGLLSMLQTGICHSTTTAFALTATCTPNLTTSKPWPAICIHVRPAWPNLLPAPLWVLALLTLPKPGRGVVDGAPPMLWRTPFPHSIQSKLVTDVNPHGNLTISDFELAGVVAHQDILPCTVSGHLRMYLFSCHQQPSRYWPRQ